MEEIESPSACKYSRIVSTMNGRSLTFDRSTVTGASQPSTAWLGLVTETSTRSPIEAAMKLRAPRAIRARLSGSRSLRSSGGAFDRRVSANPTAGPESSKICERRSQTSEILGDSVRPGRADSVVSLIRTGQCSGARGGAGTLQGQGYLRRQGVGTQKKPISQKFTERRSTPYHSDSGLPPPLSAHRVRPGDCKPPRTDTPHTPLRDPPRHESQHI